MHENGNNCDFQERIGSLQDLNCMQTGFYISNWRCVALEAWLDIDKLQQNTKDRKMGFCLLWKWLTNSYCDVPFIPRNASGMIRLLLWEIKGASYTVVVRGIETQTGRAKRLRFPWEKPLISWDYNNYKEGFRSDDIHEVFFFLMKKIDSREDIKCLVDFII